MFFDYLIVHLAQKAEKYNFLKIRKSFEKNRKFSKFPNFSIFLADFLNFQIHEYSLLLELQ